MTRQADAARKRIRDQLAELVSDCEPGVSMLTPGELMRAGYSRNDASSISMATRRARSRDELNGIADDFADRIADRLEANSTLDPAELARDLPRY